MVHYSVPSRHVGSAQWYAVVYPAAMLVQHNGTLQRTKLPCWFSTMVHYSVPSRHVGSVQWYTIVYPATMLVQYNGTLQRTKLPCWFSTMVHYSVPPCWFSTMVHYSVPSRHVGSAQWYTIVYPAAMLVQYNGTL